MSNDIPSDKPVMTIDYGLYAHYLEDADINDDQKREFLEILWHVICDFVALGFQVHPLQEGQSDCGQAIEKAFLRATQGQAMLDFDDPVTNFENKPYHRKRGEGSQKDSAHDKG